MEILFQSEKFHPTQLKTINDINDESSRFYKHQQVPANTHNTPEVYYTKITNVKAIGGSNFLLKDKICLVHDQYKFDTDTTSEELHDFCIINRKEKTIAIKNPSAVFSLDKAAVFTDACSANYAHWMTEVLPRIMSFLSYNKNTDIDLVLDSNLHINMYKSVLLCLNKTQNIYLIDKNIHLNIKELHYISATSYVPFEFAKPFISIEDKTGLEGRHNIKALMYTRSMLLKNNNLRIKKMKEVAQNTRHTLKKDNIEGVINILDTAPYSRLYIERRLTNKIVVNKYELDLLMSKYNFLKFDTTESTFSDQIIAFSNVDIVISNSSATLVNMMFMKPGSKLYILMANSEHVSYYYWQNQGDIFSIDIKFVLGSTYGKQDSSHPNFIVSMLDLEKELKKL
jgi:capsular polysaccharide biosynthesis protein